MALGCLAFLLALPARIYMPPMRPWALLAHMDHLSWTYTMFSQVARVRSLDVAFLDREGHRHRVEPVGRMLEATSDAELFALARDVLRRHPEAERVEVALELVVNGRRALHKRVRSVRDGSSTIRVAGSP